MVPQFATGGQMFTAPRFISPPIHGSYTTLLDEEEAIAWRSEL